MTTFAHGHHLAVSPTTGMLDTPARRLSFVSVAGSRMSNFEDWIVAITLHSDALLFKSCGGVFTIIEVPAHTASMMRREFRSQRQCKEDLVFIVCTFSSKGFDVEFQFCVQLNFTKCSVPKVQDQDLYQSGTHMADLPCSSYDVRCSYPGCKRIAHKKCEACWIVGRVTLYCRKKCQKLHWHAGHKIYCSRSLDDHHVL